MNNASLAAQLEAFVTDAALRLDLAVRDGAEIPFEVVRAGERGAPLYCYRPLTAEFIRARLGLLAGLPTYAPAARALEFEAGAPAYLRARGEARIPDAPRDRADAVLRAFLAQVFAERSAFAFDADRFAAAYRELERHLYAGLRATEVIAPLRGLALDAATRELPLAGGLTIVRQSALADPPPALVDETGPHGLVAIVRIVQAPGLRPPLGEARAILREVSTALRLYDSGNVAIGPAGYHRVEGGAWTVMAIGPVGRVGAASRVTADQEDELRGFVNLIRRRLPSIAGEARWALARFELGCDRADPYEGLTDHLLGLRALLEPEGTASGRLAQRLAVICATPEERTALAGRAARAIALETSVILGEATERWRGDQAPEALIDEVADHLRAILRDIICGHLEPDVRTLADELLAEAAAEV